MIEKIWLNHNLYLKHSPASKALIVIFPGGDNSTDIPTLHYGRKATLLLGCDVLSLHYPQLSGAPYTEQIEGCYQAINSIDYREYEKVIFLSKSIGNEIAIGVDDKYFDGRVPHVFYTPISNMTHRIKHKNCLVLTGSKDPLFTPEDIAVLGHHKKVQVHQFKDAVHSLEINDNVEESLEILRQATDLCRMFIEKLVVENENMTERVDLYDDLGQKTPRSLCKDLVHKQGLIHRGVCVWIINSRNELLLQTRSDQVMLPNYMDISFSGHIKAGETALQAAIREGQEELGIALEVDKLKYLFSCREYGGIAGYFENEIDDVFLYRADIPIEAFNFCDAEVKEVTYVPLAEFETMVQSKSPLMVPYETHYPFLLTALRSGLLRNT